MASVQMDAATQEPGAAKAAAGSAAGRARSRAPSSQSQRSTEAPGSEWSAWDDEGVEEQPADAALLSVPNTFSPEETLFIFDWDDTILPTGFLHSQGVLLDEEATWGEEVDAELQILAARAISMLEEAKRLGRVVIVTNAVGGWVESSCARFLPRLAPALEQLAVVSARSKFEALRPSNPTAWKSLAFEAEVDAFCGGLASRRSNIISIGDSEHEYVALLQATSARKGCVAKSLKLAEGPSIAQLIEEQELVFGSLAEVAQHDGDLDVDVGDGACA